MVNRLLAIFNREITGVHQAALLLGVSSLAAKVLALLRDRLLAGTFGAGETLDIYFASFRVPDFIYTLSLLIATSAAVIPVFMQREKKNPEEARRFISELTSVFALVIILLIIAAFWLTPFLAKFIAPGFSEDGLSSLILLSRILLLSPLLLGLSALVSSVIQSYRRFFIYALSPILYNAGIISGILFFYPLMGLSGLVWGVVLGAALHLFVQLPSLYALNYLPRLTLRVYWKDIFDVFRLSLPRSVSLEISQIILIAITALASAIGAGSITIFQLSHNLYSIPLSVIGLSYSLAAFPVLARSFVDGKAGEFSANVVSAVRHIIFWGTPAVVLFIILRAHMVRVILGAGAFSWVDTRLTAAALGIFSIAILAQSIATLLVRAFYAAGRAFWPLAANILSGAVVIGFSYGLIKLFEADHPLKLYFNSILRVEDLPQTSVLVLVFAFSLGAVINVVLLWAGLVRIFRFIDGELRVSLAENALAGVILGAAAYGILQMTDSFFNLQTFWGVLGHGFLAGFGGLIAGGVVHWLRKNAELFEVIQAIRLKFWKTPVIAPEPSSASEG